MIAINNVFKDTEDYKIFMRVETYKSLIDNKILYHDSREPNLVKLQVAYKKFFDKYNNGKKMFFMWREYCDDSYFNIIESSEFVLLKLEIPSSLRILHVCFDEWCSFICNLKESESDVSKELNMCEIFMSRAEESLEDMLHDDSDYYGDQHLIDYLDSSWITDVKYVDRLIRS